MKRQIHIGYAGQNRSWEQLLEQIGVSWARVSPADDLSAEKFSCLVVDRDLASAERQRVENYLSTGGSVLDATGQLMDQKPVSRNIERICPEDSETLFSHIEEIPVYGSCLCHPSSSMLGGAVWADPSPERSVIFTGLPVHLLWKQHKTVHRTFSSSDGVSAAERVSKLQSHPYLEVILSLLKTLHHSQQLPFVHKWWSPETGKQAATFRIDTDYGTQKSIMDLNTLVKEYDIPSTWFLHVTAHEDSLDHLLTILDEYQELSLHCYRHSEFREADSYVTDIKHSLDILRKYDVSPAGYAAPYGWWSDQLAEALSDFSFAYSSEFCYDYDSLPSESPDSGIFQLPVHPVSAGSFQRFSRTEPEVSAYFDELLNLKNLQHQPVHLFHHPNDGRHSFLNNLFTHLNTDRYRLFTFRGWLGWWKSRQSASLAAEYDSSARQLVLKQSGGANVPFAVHKGDRFLIAESGENVVHLDGETFIPYIAPELRKLARERRSSKKLTRLTLRKDQFLTYLWRNRT